jgi:hypothetical protein
MRRNTDEGREELGGGEGEEEEEEGRRKLQTLTRRTFDSVALQRRMRTVQQQ